jgi:hypothetical protein
MCDLPSFVDVNVTVLNETIPKVVKEGNGIDCIHVAISVLG